MTIWVIMALKIDGTKQIQPYFAVTKLVTVLIFALFAHGISQRGLDKASIVFEIPIR